MSEGVTGDKDSEGKRPPADMEPKPTPGGAHNLGTGSKDQVDKTQSTRLEGSGPSQNEGKSSYEEEPDNLIL